MVGHYADGDVDLLLSVGALAVGSFGEGVAVFLAREVLDLGDDGREDVGVVVGTLALHEAHQALEAHARIDDVHLQRLQAAVGLAVILHEHDVPNLDNLRMVLVDQFLARHLGLLFLRAEVDVDLRAGTAGACVAHLPEVVVLVSVDDVVLGEMLCPVAGSLVVAAEVLAGVALKHGDVKVFRVEVEHVDQILVGVVDGALLEVIAETPVAEHLKHGVVAQSRVASHFLQVVMLTADAQAFLRVGATTWVGFLGAENNVFPLVHTSVGEHEGGVVLDYNRSRRYDDVSF